MAPNWILFRIASLLPLIAIGLAVANWNTNPGVAWSWAVVIALSVVMVAVLRFWQRALNRSPGNAALVRGVNSVAGAIAFGGLMTIIPLALALARSSDIVQYPVGWILRAIIVVTGAYLAVTGNAMPRMLPPTTAVQLDVARIQAFQRLAGWTWVFCGLGFAIAGLTLPIDVAAPITFVLFATAIIVTIVDLLRLRNPRPQTHKYAGIVMGIIYGVSCGAGLGTALDNPALGAGFGMCMGIGLGVCFGALASPGHVAASDRKKAVSEKPPPYPLGL